MNQHYSTNKAKELFEDRSDTMVVRKLKQIHTFGTYVPTWANNLFLEKRKKKKKKKEEDFE